MVHTAFHFKVHHNFLEVKIAHPEPGHATNAAICSYAGAEEFVCAPCLQGALDRFAQFFISPLLLREAAMAEVENVHAEYSRNCNSDQRKLLQVDPATARCLHAPPASRRLAITSRTRLIIQITDGGPDVSSNP